MPGMTTRRPHRRRFEPEYEPAYHASEPEAAADDQLDLSLEEELSAMLDDAHAEPEVGVVRA